MESFRHSLGEFASTITREDGKKPPLIIIIDELDRCRPTFAIGLLERVKHLFSVQNVVFVLSIDRQQLGHSIAGVYGSGMDAEGYLRRFIHLEYQLPEPQRIQFAEFLVDRLDIATPLHDRRSPESPETLTETFARSSELFDLSLRAMEEGATSMNVAIRTTPKGLDPSTSAVAFLVALRLAHSTLYTEFRDGTLASNMLIEKLQQRPRSADFLASELGTVVKANLQILTYADSDFDAAVDQARVLFENSGQQSHAGTLHSTLWSTEAKRLHSQRRAFFGRLDLTRQFKAQDV